MSEFPVKRSPDWRWWVCGLLLLATMLNYMDRQTLSQSAPDITKELKLSNEDYGKLERGFGLAFAAGGIVLGFVADKVSVRWLYPAVLVAWSAAGFATGWARGYSDLMLCRVLLGFFEAGQWPCALTASQRLLAPRDRAMGNSVLQSGAAIGAIITPLVVQALSTDQPGSWRGPFQVIGVLGIFWTIVWLLMIRKGDLDLVEPKAGGEPETSTTSHGMFIRRCLVLAVIVIAINLYWQFFRAWLPKMLREQHGYSRAFVAYFTSAYYIATDVGCLGAGLAVKLLSSRGKTVHTSRVLIFLACSLLTALSMVIAVIPAGPLMLGILLLIGAGSLGLFPIYYSLTQDLSTRHQGKLIGLLACTAWIATSVMQQQIGVWVDRTGSYSTILFIMGLLPLVALAGLFLFWDQRSDLIVPERDPEFA